MCKNRSVDDHFIKKEKKEGEKDMHPNHFFTHVTMLDESFIPGGAQALLASAHPKNLANRNKWLKMPFT